MTIEASYAARPAISPQAAFSWGLIAATILPFVSIAASNNFGGAAAVALALFFIASGHVVATSYLLADPEVRRYLSNRPIKMIVTPVALAAGGLLLFSLSGVVLSITFVVFAIYQAWHFGAQNIGVASFISLSERGRPLHRREKILIRCGIVAGMLGVLQAMMPVTAVWFVPLGYIIGVEVPSFAYKIGAVAAIPVAGVAIWMMIQGFRAGHYRFGIAIALSACFLFPMYLTHNYFLGFVSFALAHGVQYLIFLFTHAVGERQPTTEGRARLGMLALLIALVIAGACIWNIPAIGNIPRIGVAIVPALTLAHFWIDLFLWRMKDPDRAAWIKARFGTVIRPQQRFPSPSPPTVAR